MKSFLYAFFHKETNDRTEQGSIYIPNDDSLWPDSWKKIYYKTYPLFKPLPLPSVEGVLFDRLLISRDSEKARETSGVLTLDTLSYILLCGYGLRNKDIEFRTVPSAGKRYPLEVYIFLFKDINGLESGIYHYNVRNHTLEVVENKTFSPEELKNYFSYEWLGSKSAMICLTSVFNRVTDKYGNRGYRYILLEAGHVGQNMLLAGTEKSLQGIPIGGLNESAIEKTLALEISYEKVVYSLFF